jgi:hypothetical protein
MFVNGGIDTTGSLISDWEMVTARSLTENRHDIKVTALAEADQAIPYHLGLQPQMFPELLFRMNVRIYETLPEDDSTVTILIINNLSETNFSDPYGNLIGTITDYNICDSCYCETWDYVGDSCLTGCIDTLPELYDTLALDTFFRWHTCIEWGLDSQGQDSCLNWSSYSNFDDVPGGVFDSMSIDSVPWTIWNEETAFLDLNGGHLSIVVITCLCGDVNTDGLVNVGDAVYMIAWIFNEGADPLYVECCDVNNDGQPNVGDVVHLINYIFKEGPDPNCGF